MAKAGSLKPTDDQVHPAASDISLPDRPNRSFITALARGLEVMRAFEVNDPPLSNQELARRTGLPRPTISRITHTLTELGFLNYRAQFGCYELGGGAVGLGNVARSNFDTASVANPLMKHMAAFSGCNVGLGTRERHEMIYLKVCHGPSRIVVNFDVGARISMLHTGMGRAYLAGAPEPEVAELGRQLVQEHGVEPDEFARTLANARGELQRQGFCVSAGDWNHEINGVGAPIAVRELGGTFVLNCGAPAYYLPKSKLLREIGPELAKTAAGIADLLQELLKTRAVADTKTTDRPVMHRGSRVGRRRSQR